MTESRDASYESVRTESCTVEDDEALLSTASSPCVYLRCVCLCVDICGRYIEILRLLADKDTEAELPAQFFTGRIQAFL